MKKLTLLIVLFSGIIAVNAQITMTMESHGLMVGDAHDFILANAVDEGAAGEDITWDFSGLVPNDKTLTSYMLDPAETEKGESIKNSNTVLQEYKNQFYFNVNEEAIEQYGTVACNTVTTYDKPFVKMQYPFTYGSNFYGSFSGAYHYQNGEKPFDGIYDVEADGYGTLLLPGNTQIDNVLRVKTVRTRIYGEYESSVVTYRWYAANVRYPLLVIIQHIDSKGNEKTSTVAYYKNAGKLKSAPLAKSDMIAQETGDGSVNVYPNPYKDNVNIEYALQNAGLVNITLYDNLGRKVKILVNNEEQEAGSHHLSFSTKANDFNSGMYFIRINTENDTHIKKIVEFD